MVCSSRAALSDCLKQKVNKTNWLPQRVLPVMWESMMRPKGRFNSDTSCACRPRPHYWEGFPLWHDQSQPPVADAQTQRRSCPLRVPDPRDMCRTLLWLWLQQVLPTQRWLLHPPHLWPERQQDLLGRLDGTRVQQRFVTNAQPADQWDWEGFGGSLSRLHSGARLCRQGWGLMGQWLALYRESWGQGKGSFCLALKSWREYWALSRCVLSLIIHIFALGKKTQPTDFNGISAADFKKDFPFGAELQDKQEGETCFRADLASVKLWCLRSPRLVCSTWDHVQHVY